MNTPIRLLAKSSNSPDSPNYYESYVGHLVETTNVARRLSVGRGEVFLESMGLDPNRWLRKLEEAATRGSFLHDIGKANYQLQRLVSRQSTFPQAFRHELISLLLALQWTPLSEWIFKDCDDDMIYSSLFAASGHHLKFDGPELAPREGSGDGTLILYTGHADIKKVLERGREFFAIPALLPISGNMELDLLGDPMEDVRNWILHKALPWWEKSDSEVRRFVALLKALVVGADLVASAVARDENTQGWVDSVLGRVCSPNDLLKIVQRKLGDNLLRPFQERVARSPSRVTFVHAGCGTGKTVAAYLWAKERASGRKVFVCYPTTGTASQGYEDYAYDDGIDSRLIHSRSEVDLEALREAAGDETDLLTPFSVMKPWPLMP